MREFEQYANQVIRYIPGKQSMKKRIKEDILSQLDDMNLREGYDDPREAMGEPQEVAQEFIKNLDIKPSVLTNRNFEFRSKTEILGLPLVHITNGNKVAKGIIAIGGVSIGVFSLGGLSLGLFSFGGVSLGLLLALGGASFSIYLAIGGVAVGYFGAIGGLAISKVLAIGGEALAQDIAIGDVAKATVCGYKSSFEGIVGVHLPSEAHRLSEVVREYFPNLDRIYYWIINAITQ
jgi:hypothetical protein